VDGEPEPPYILAMDSTIPSADEMIEVAGVTFRHGDLDQIVSSFYGKVAGDDLLKDPFRSVHDWPEHIKRLTHFWWTRFGGPPYLLAQYAPVPKHYFAGFSEPLLKRWLELFNETLEEHAQPEQKALWSSVVDRMGQAFLVKNQMFHEYLEKNKPGGSSES